MKNERSGLPIFLENSPSVICDQVLWLIKNSGLNFQVKETPFSLDINLKKRFANLWNQRNGHPVSNQSPSHVSSQHHENHVSQESQILENKSELLSKIDSLRANLEETSLHKNEASKELFELDQAHRKLLKENKELLKKHERVCSELKAVKEEKEKTAKENNSLSVALKASRKTLEESLGNFKKETNLYKDELEKLNQFKLERDAEMKAARKAEKKRRQKERKEANTAEDDPNVKAELVVHQKIMDDEVEDTEKKNLEPFKAKSEANDPENNYDDNFTVHEDSYEVTNTFKVKDIVMEAPVTKEDLFEQFRTRFGLS